MLSETEWRDGVTVSVVAMTTTTVAAAGDDGSAYTMPERKKTEECELQRASDS